MASYTCFPMGPYCCFSPLIFSFSLSFSCCASSRAPSSCSVVDGGGVVVVGSGVVRMQEGGVQDEREKSPVLPKTWEYFKNAITVQQGADVDHTLVMKAYSS